MILAVDAGNTRIKWGFYDGQAWCAHGQLVHSQRAQLAAALDALPAPRRIVLCNVAGAAAQAELETILARFGAPLIRVSARALQCGVKNGYARPEQLGPDRWAALIGAHHLRMGTALVVVAGTTLTVDALHDGRFLGGIIAPGYQMMRTALCQGAAGLAGTPGEFSAFPDNTGDAMETGSMLALTGAVAAMRDTLARRAGGAPILVVSGGDAPRLLPHLPEPRRRVENLVLEGLRIIAEEGTP